MSSLSLPHCGSASFVFLETVSYLVMKSCFLKEGFSNPPNQGIVFPDFPVLWGTYGQYLFEWLIYIGILFREKGSWTPAILRVQLKHLPMSPYLGEGPWVCMPPLERRGRSWTTHRTHERVQDADGKCCPTCKGLCEVQLRIRVIVIVLVQKLNISIIH